MYLFYSVQFPPIIFCCSNLSYVTQLSISFSVLIEENWERNISESTRWFVLWFSKYLFEEISRTLLKLFLYVYLNNQ